MGKYREAWQKGYNDPKPLGPVGTIFWTLVFGAIFVTVGWNYGASEIVQALNGPDGNVNILEGGAAFIFAATVGRALKGE